MMQSWMPVRVTGKKLEAEGVFIFELADIEGRDLPLFTAGSHIDVEVKPRLVRQYSLCNHPENRSLYRIAVLRAPSSRGGSAGMIDQVEVGSKIRISHPKNHFSLVRAASHYILIAGGIGITPIMCMAERLANVDREFELHYCTRSKSRTAFLEYLARATFAEKVQFYFDDGPTEQRFDIAATLGAPERGKHLYVCGPPGMIDSVIATATAHGWSAGNIHREFFGAEPKVLVDGDAFDVQIASTGKRYTIPADKSVVDVLLDAGIEIPVSCQQGVCGTCLTRVIQGEPDHRDMYLTNDERVRNDQFTPCCSRSNTKTLVLDL